ncbi:hypothetical protein FRC00_014178, partial [Tulasnella sp. 408]
MEKCITKPDQFYLANTIVDYHAGVPADAHWSRTLTVTVLSLKEGMAPPPPQTLGRKIGWTMKAVEDYCRSGLLGKRDQDWVLTPRPLNVILSAYRQPGPFSLDLASAVLRQMNFIEKMVNLGFTEQARWEEDHDTLTRCVVRYHHFLDLMASTSGNFVVPTLVGSTRNAAASEPGVPDHDDKVGQGALSDAYDKTAEAWRARFGVPYSICGCLPPSDNSSGPSGSSFSLFSKKGKSKSKLERP